MVGKCCIQSYIDLNSKKLVIKNEFYRGIYKILIKLRFTKTILLQPVRTFLWSKNGSKIFYYLYNKEKIEIETIPQVVADQVK